MVIKMHAALGEFAYESMAIFHVYMGKKPKAVRSFRMMGIREHAIESVLVLLYRSG